MTDIKYKGNGEPAKCECGCEQFIHKNVEYVEHVECEYDIHCKKCDKFLAYFAYGSYLD